MPNNFDPFNPKAIAGKMKQIWNGPPVDTIKMRAPFAAHGSGAIGATQPPDYGDAMVVCGVYVGYSRKIEELRKEIDEKAMPGRERALAINALEEAEMWLERAAKRHDERHVEMAKNSVI